MAQKEGIFRVEYMPGENFRDYDLLFIERSLTRSKKPARRRVAGLAISMTGGDRRQGLSGMTPWLHLRICGDVPLWPRARQQLCDDLPPRTAAGSS